MASSVVEAQRRAPAGEKDVPSVATTALWVAHMRAEEAKMKRPLIEDPLAEALAGEEGKAFAARYAEVTKRSTGQVSLVPHVPAPLVYTHIHTKEKGRKESSHSNIHTLYSHMCVLGMLDYDRNMLMYVMCACTYVLMYMVRVSVRCACAYGVTYTHN